ncbi:hypothetical protein BDQ12DRAFT_650282 [Crucibulum laeve]|uniref:DUF6699 domain-containing protein n=1 Tax=Crucibulum laeve TaxID=68775 RepID=A0A5C3M496_9AGAR|nr:hypothetical protein BDQ12DRAFT_650282 [Crucibulum laeve]
MNKEATSGPTQKLYPHQDPTLLYRASCFSVRMTFSHAGFYRPVNDPTRPWAPSPVHSESSTLVGYAGNPRHAFESPGSSSSNLVLVQKDYIPTIAERPKKRRFPFFGRLKALFRARQQEAESHDVDIPSPELEVKSPPDIVGLHEWKCWAYYSHPTVNGVEVYNSPPLRPLSAIEFVDFEQVFETLRGPRGTPHPERWIRGIQHPALPPRPSRWEEPRMGEPQAFPWECQLNPFLVHHLKGPSPLVWDLSKETFRIMYGGTDVAICLSDADKAQPATWPFVTHFYINAIAEDTSPKLIWPITVHNPRGVKFLLQEEFDSWGSVRRHQVTQAYYQRHPEGWGDGLRRIDYLGHLVMFRGLEPNPDHEGWMMYVGLA